METTQTTYHLNTRELDTGFLDILREAFPERIIEVTVREVDPYTLDADTYLRLYKAHSKHLDEAIEEIRQREDFIPIDGPEDAEAYARDPSAYIARRKAEWAAERKAAQQPQAAQQPAAVPQPAAVLVTEAAAS